MRRSFKPTNLFFKAAALFCFALPVFFPGYISVWAANYLSFGYSLQYGRPSDPSPLGSELGIATVDDETSTTVNFAEMDDPVVIAGPPSFHDAKAGVVAISNVTTNSFDVIFREWLSDVDPHAAEIFPYLVMEKGTHLKPCDTPWDTPCNVIIKVGRFTQSTMTGFSQSVSFETPFPDGVVPHLFLTLQTDNEGIPLEVRGKNVDNSGFDSFIYEQEATQGTADVMEDVGYLAIWSPDGSGEMKIGGDYLPYLLQRENVDERWTPTVSTAIKVEETDFPDVNHPDERLDILALGRVVFAQDNSINDSEAAGLRQKPPEYTEAMEWGTVNGVTDQWVTIPLSKDYAEPVVVAYQGKPSEDNNLGVVRLQNFDGHSFHARFQFWDYRTAEGASYNDERIHYLVAEQGSQRLGSGLLVLAGKLESDKLLEDEAFDTVDISSVFTPTIPIFPLDVPAVFSSVMSFHEPIPRLTRVGGVTLSQFEISQQEEEGYIGSDWVRNPEILGWIAVKKGVDTVDDKNGGRKVDVNSVVVNDASVDYLYRIDIDQQMPVVLGHIDTVQDIDTATVGQGDVDNTQVSVKVQEEQSADLEVMHFDETLGIIILE